MRFVLVMLVLLPLSSCGIVKSAVKGVVGGSPSVLANGQAGKTNTQTAFGNTTNNDLKLVRPKARTINQSQDDSSLKADTVDTVVINEVGERDVWRDLKLLIVPSPLGLILWPLLLWLRRKILTKLRGV